MAEVSQLIYESKTHKPTSTRNALFLDADLSILGTDSINYQNYIKQIRQEYAIYNDDVYRDGRKKVLAMFLEKERIYMSEYFYERYEQKARSNIVYELTVLSP